MFELYPDIETAYNLSNGLRLIYSKTKHKSVAYTKFAHWYKDVEKAGFKSFNTIIATIYTHYENIINFFNNRSTNASAESFNAKIKAFRGVTEIEYFLFRVTKIYA